MEYNCVCIDSNYCTNSFDEFIKCKNYNSFQNYHSIIKLINNQSFDHSEIKLNFNINNKNNKNIVKLIKLFLDLCTKIKETLTKKIICIIIFELIFNNLELVKLNKNFENTIRNKIHTFFKESFNEFEEFSKYNHNINPIITIKRLFELYFPEK